MQTSRGGSEWAAATESQAEHVWSILREEMALT
jgi:hypothetical protein